MTEPVYLRPLQLSDTDDIVRWRNTESVRRNLFTQTLLTAEQHRHYFDTVIRSGRCRQYIIVERGTEDTPIGTVFLKNIDTEKKTAEFGIFIGETLSRGKGFAGSATRQILDIAFKELGIDEVVLYVVEDNYPAINCYERQGFVETGRERGAFSRAGILLDVIEMKLTQNRWQTSGGSAE